MPRLTPILWKCVQFEHPQSKKVARNSLVESQIGNLKAGEIALQ